MFEQGYLQGHIICLLEYSDTDRTSGWKHYLVQCTLFLLHIWLVFCCILVFDCFLLDALYGASDSKSLQVNNFSWFLFLQGEHLCIWPSAEPVAQLSALVSASLHAIPTGCSWWSSICEGRFDQRRSAGSLQPHDEDMAGAPFNDSQETEFSCRHLWGEKHQEL